MAVLVCLVVLPAVLYLLGPRVAAWRLPWLPSTRDRSRRRWDRLARPIMARPVAALAITSAALLALAVPALGLQTDSGDASVLPKSSSVRQGYDLVEEQYGKGAVEPILVVIESDRSFSGADDFARLAAMINGFGQLNHAARVASPVPVLQAVMPADPLAAIEPTNFQRLPEDSRTTINRFVSADRKTIAIDVFSNERAGDSDIEDASWPGSRRREEQRRTGLASIGRGLGRRPDPLLPNSFRMPPRWSSRPCSSSSTCCWP